MADLQAGDPPEPPSAAAAAAANPAECPLRGCARRRLRAVEPVLLLATLALGLQSPLCTQFLWDRLGAGNGTGPGPGPGPGPGGGCPNDTGSGQQELETLVAHWNLYLNLAGFFVGLFSVTLFGPWSDSAGRRPALILPALGMALQAAVYLAVMYAELPVGYLLVGRVLSGLSGDYNLVLASCFAYVADVSDRRARTFRVAILEACLGLAGMAASVLGGRWRKAQGYLAPFWLVFAASLAAALYSALVLQESVPQKQPRRLLTLRHYAAVYRLYASPDRGQAWRKLLLYSLAFFVVVTVHFGAQEILVLYELSAPLCWGPELIGYGSAAHYLTYLSSLAGLRLLQMCMEDTWVAEVGLLSNVLGLVTMALAGTTPLMFTGYGLLFLSMTVTPVIRSKLSRLVGETEQGALFAAVACVEGLCSLVATGVFSSLFPACLSFMKGFPFLFGAVLLLVPATILGSPKVAKQNRRFGRTTSVSRPCPRIPHRVDLSSSLPRWIEIRDSTPRYQRFADVPGPSPEAEP